MAIARKSRTFGGRRALRAWCQRHDRRRTPRRKNFGGESWSGSSNHRPSKTHAISICYLKYVADRKSASFSPRIQEADFLNQSHT